MATGLRGRVFLNKLIAKASPQEPSPTGISSRDHTSLSSVA